MNNKNLTVINLFGGAGVGKSTIAASLFSYLKSNLVSCELVTEYVKDVVWDNSANILANQLLVTANQYHKLFRLIDKVDIAVCDSSLLVGSVYDNTNPKLNELVLDLYNSFTNINLFVERKTKYDTTGRYQTEEQAIEIDNEIKNYLFVNDIKVHSIISCNTNISTLVKTLDHIKV